MATEKNFRVKKGLDVKSGAVTVENAPSSNAADLIVLKDGTNEIGKIKYSANDNLAVYASAANHAGINFIENAIIPMSAGAETDAAISLGDSTRAFKDLYLSGDLNIAGAINSTATTATNLEIEDITITLNKSDSDSSSAANGAGIVIQDAVDASTDASILWNTTNDEFDFSNGITVNGDISLPDHVDEDTENSIVEDSAKIKLGTGDDLQLFHDGSNSIIQDVGDGNLRIKGNGSIQLRSSADDSLMVNAIAGAEVQLRYNDDTKIETTSSGVLVSGNVAVGHGVGTQGQVLENGNTNVATLRFDSESWRIWTGHDSDGAGAGAAIDSELLRLTSGGNLGVGTFSNTAEPTHHLHLMSATTNTNTAEDIIKIESKSSGTTAVGFGANILFNAERADGTQQDQGRIGFAASINNATSGSENLSSDFVIGTATDGTISNKVFVKASGNVGIGPFVSGTTDPARKLHVLGSGSTIAAMIEASDGSQASVDLKNNEGEHRLISDGGEFYVYDQGDTAERFRIDTSGNVGIGGVDPAAKLHVDGTTTITGALTLGDIVFPTAKGSANEILAMNAGATALEFVTPYGDSNVDTHLNQSTANANEVLIWSGSDYSWGAPPAINNIALDNTNVTITDNGSDAGYITATVDGSAIVTINADGITADNITASTKFIGDVKGASFFTAKAGENLTKGQLVHITGYDSTDDLATVEKASASTGGEYGVGLVMADATNGNSVDILTEGILSGFDTTAFNAGDTVYMGSTAGELVTVPPAGNQSNIQRVGRILKDHASSGSIYFYGSGQIADVKSLDESKIFVGNASNYAIQVDNTLEVDMANSEVRTNSKLHVFPNSAIVGKKSVLEFDGSAGLQTIRQTSLRNSDNAIYSGGDATGYDHFDAIVLDADSDDAKISLYHTTGNTASDSHNETIRLLSDGDSYISNRLAVGYIPSGTLGDSALSLKGSAQNSAGSVDALQVFSNNTDNNADNDIIVKVGSRVSTGTGSDIDDSHGYLILNTALGSPANTTTSKIALHASPDVTSTISGDLDVVDALTAGSVASDTTLATGSYTLPNSSGSAGQVLAYPSSNSTLEWVNPSPDIDEIPLAMNTVARTMGWAATRGYTDHSALGWDIDDNALKLSIPASAMRGVAHKPIFVRGGETVELSYQMKGSVTTGSSIFVYLYQLHETATVPVFTAGKTHVTDAAGNSIPSDVHGISGTAVTTKTINLSQSLNTSWQSFRNSVTFEKSGWVSFNVWCNTTASSSAWELYLKQPIMEAKGLTIHDAIAIKYLVM